MQYEKFAEWKRKVRRDKEAAMWQGRSKQAAESRPPPKLQFKQLMETTGPAPHQTMIDTLTSMGFSREQAEAATRACNGRSVEDAAAFLLSGAANSESRRRRAR